MWMAVLLTFVLRDVLSRIAIQRQGTQATVFGSQLRVGLTSAVLLLAENKAMA